MGGAKDVKDVSHIILHASDSVRSCEWLDAVPMAGLAAQVFRRLTCLGQYTIEKNQWKARPTYFNLVFFSGGLWYHFQGFVCVWVALCMEEDATENIVEGRGGSGKY